MAYNAASVKKTQKQRRALVRRFKAFHGCGTCGEKDPNVLDLHHVDPADKSDKLTKVLSTGRHLTGGAQWSNLSFPDLVTELRKCEVLCANCHRRVTAAERGWGDLDRLPPSDKALAAAFELGIHPEREPPAPRR